jgi:hypothetical protein
MKIIRESLSFERGLEPKKALNIGQAKIDRDIIENTNWAIDPDKPGFIYEIIELIRDYRGYPILILKNKQQESRPYRGISKRGVFGGYRSTPEAALNDAKRVVNDDITLMRESLNFKGGLSLSKQWG